MNTLHRVLEALPEPVSSAYASHRETQAFTKPCICLSHRCFTNLSHCVFEDVTVAETCSDLYSWYSQMSCRDTLPGDCILKMQKPWGGPLFSISGLGRFVDHWSQDGLARVGNGHLYSILAQQCNQADPQRPKVTVHLGCSGPCYSMQAWLWEYLWLRCCCGQL